MYLEGVLGLGVNIKGQRSKILWVLVRVVLMNDDNTWDPMKGHCCSMVLLLVKHVHWQIERENGLVVSKTCSLRERERERERSVMKIELEATMDPLVSFRWKEMAKLLNEMIKKNQTSLCWWGGEDSPYQLF